MSPVITTTATTFPRLLYDTVQYSSHRFTLESHCGCTIVAYFDGTVFPDPALPPPPPPPVPRRSHTHSPPAPDRSCSRSGRCKLAFVAANPEEGRCQPGLFAVLQVLLPFFFFVL